MRERESKGQHELKSLYSETIFGRQGARRNVR
jgi:hypothetical protein